MFRAYLLARQARGNRLELCRLRRLHQDSKSCLVVQLTTTTRASRNRHSHHTFQYSRGIATSSLFGERVSPEAVAGAVAELRDAGLHVVAAVDEDPDAAREVALKSRDFFWYSPILKETLRGQRGDALVVARDEDDVIAVAGCAARRGVPLIARGGEQEEGGRARDGLYPARPKALNTFECNFIFQ